MNRADLRGLVISNTNRRDKADLINQAINMAVVEMSQVHDFRANRSMIDIPLASGTGSVLLPENVFQVLNVRLMDDTDSLNSRIIQYRDKTWILQRFPNLEATIQSWPVYCFVDTETNNLVFVPQSSRDWTVRLEYFQLFPQMTLDTDQPTFSLENTIIAWVTAYVFRSIQMFGEADKYMAEYTRALSIAVQADKRTNTKRVMEGFHPDRNAGIIAPPHLDPFNQTGEP